MKLRIISLLLAVFTVAAVSCSAPADKAVTENNNAPVTESAQTEAETEITPDLPEEDFEGYEFTIMSKGTAHNSHWYAKDIFAEEMNGDAINDAVYTRNSTIYDRYNVIIKEDGVADPLGTAKQTITAADDVYDAISAGLNGCIESLQSSNYLINLNSVEYLDLTKPWWDKRSVEDLSIAGNLFGVTGDIIIMDKDATWVILYSKDMAANYNLEDIYTLVNDNKWVFDTFNDMCIEVSSDVDGDGKMTVADAYGHMGETFNTFAMLTGFGDRIISKDADGLPYVSILDLDTVSHMERVVKLISDPNYSLLSNRVTGYNDVWADAFHPAFGEGRILFYLTGLNRVTLLRDQTADFGIIPMPKYDSEQDRYYNAISLWASSGIAIPMTVTELSRTGFVLEALCAESRKTLLPAYYDITLKGKAARDTESEAMLDIIFASRQYDLGLQYNWGGIFGIWDTLTSSGSTDVASAYAKIEKSVLKAMQNTIDGMSN